MSKINKEEITIQKEYIVRLLGLAKIVQEKADENPCEELRTAIILFLGYISALESLVK